MGAAPLASARHAKLAAARLVRLISPATLLLLIACSQPPAAHPSKLPAATSPLPRCGPHQFASLPESRAAPSPGSRTRGRPRPRSGAHGAGVSSQGGLPQLLAGAGAPPQHAHDASPTPAGLPPPCSSTMPRKAEIRVQPLPKVREWHGCQGGRRRRSARQLLAGSLPHAYRPAAVSCSAGRRSREEDAVGHHDYHGPRPHGQ